MKPLATQPLIRVSCMNKGEKIGLVAYSDLIVHDKDNTIVALRIGGYPEAVQGMSDIIIAGCDLELQGSRTTIRVTTKGHKNYERRLSHDGVYAEGMHYLKDDVPNTIMLSDIHEDVLHTSDKYMKKVLINAKHRFFREFQKSDSTGHPHYELERCQAVLSYEEIGFLLADSETFDVGGQKIQLERSELTEALLTLSKQQLDIIMQLVFLETPQEQLAAEFGISDRMIRKHRDNAFAKLRRYLTNEDKK